MKKKTKPNLEDCRHDLNGLTNALYEVDVQSQAFLCMSELTPLTRLCLNSATRELKRGIVLAQTDLWNKLIEADNLAALPANKPDDYDYQIMATYKPKKKKRKCSK